MKIELTDKQSEFLMRCLLQNYASTKEDFTDSKDIGATGPAEFLIGKLVSGDRKLYDVFCDIKNANYKKSEPLNKLVFWGAGYLSLLDGNYLHKRLQQAFITQGGMQQNGGMGTEFDEKSDTEDKSTLVSIVKDIMIGLGLTLEDLNE